MPSYASEERAGEKRWVEGLIKQSEQTKRDANEEKSIILKSINLLGNLKALSPADLEDRIKNGEIKFTVEQISEKIIPVLKMISEALRKLQNDEENFLNVYNSIPNRVTSQLSEDRALMQLRRDVREIVQNLDKYRLYWEENRNSNKITSPWFSDFKKVKIEKKLLAILNDDEKLNKRMLGILSEVYTKLSQHAWH